MRAHIASWLLQISCCVPQCAAKPEGDTYKFTHFAHKLMASKGLNPLLSDSRRRKDRLALQVRSFGHLYSAEVTSSLHVRCVCRLLACLRRLRTWLLRWHGSTAAVLPAAE